MPAIQLHQRKYEDLITRRGKSVLWEQAMRCSCWNEASGNPNYACQACGGEGFLYDEPIQEDAVLVMSLVLNREFTPVGDFRMGDAIATIPRQKKVVNPNNTPPNSYVDVPMYWIGEWDRVTLLDTEFKTTEALLRGQWFRGKAPDTLSYKYVTEIKRVIQADPDTGDVTIYQKDVDFTLNGNVIEWLPGGNSPDVGSFYTVMYLHHPTYIVYADLPQARDQDKQHFPRKVVLRYKGAL